MNSKTSIVVSLLEHICNRRKVTYDRVTIYKHCKTLFEQNSNTVCVLLIYNDQNLEYDIRGFVLEIWIANITETEYSHNLNTLQLERHDIKNHVTELDKLLLKMDPLLVGDDIHITALLCSLDTLKCFIHYEYDTLFNLQVSKYALDVSLVRDTPYPYNVVSSIMEHNNVNIDTSIHIEENFFSKPVTIQHKVTKATTTVTQRNTVVRYGSPIGSLFSRILGTSPIKEEKTTIMSNDLKRFINRLDQIQFPLDF